MQEKDNVLRILKETKRAVKSEDNVKLKELSNQTIHTASIYQDADNIAIAVLIYALSKILERKNFQQYRNYHRFFRRFMICIDRAISALEKNQDNYLRAQLTCIRKEINNLTGNLKKHVKEVFRKAEINKASRIYEHGISMQQTAHLLGISVWDLAEYTGATGIGDVNLGITMPEKERIKMLEEITKSNREKILIFDSSSIINFVMNGMEDTLAEFKKIFRGKLIITQQVKRETIDKPINNKLFELGALKVSKLLNNKILELPESIGINSSIVTEKTSQILKGLKCVFSSKNVCMHIVDDGEVSCLALSQLAQEKNIENVIVIDERTTRMLGEKPENLRKLFERKFHTEIRILQENMPKLDKIKFVRSSELIYLAYRKNLIKLQDGKVLDALLYATKFKGSSISIEEIEEMKRL